MSHGQSYWPKLLSEFVKIQEGRLQKSKEWKLPIHPVG